MSIHRVIHLALLVIVAFVTGASLGAWALTLAAVGGIVACLLLVGQGKHLVKLATFLTGVALVVSGGLAVEKSGLISLAFTAALLALFVIWSTGLLVDEDDRISISVSFYAALVIAFFLLGGLPVTWSGEGRICVACIVVSLGVAAWGTGQSTKRLRRTKGEKGGGARWPAAAAGIVALVGVVLGAFLAPLPWAGDRVVQLGDGLRQAVPQLGEFADWISGRGGEDESEGGAGSADLGGGGPGYDFGRRRELPQRAELVQGRAPVVHLRIPDRTQFQKYIKGQGYVRSWVLDRYIGDGWDEPEAEGAYRSDANDGEIDGWVRLGESGERGIVHEVFLPNAGGAGLPAIQNATAYQLDFLVESAPDMFEAELRGAVRYVAESSPRYWDEIRGLRPDPAAVPRPALGAQAPGQLGVSLQLLTTKVTAAARTPAERLDAIQAYIRDNHTYAMRIENTEDRSPMENFLFGERVGWCDYFATAAVLMAREAGFPARMAYGFSGGQAFAKEQIITYREDDAHAWAEILVAGYGWVIFDATPQGEGAAKAPEGGAKATAPDLSEYRAAESNPGEQEAQRPRGSLPAWVHWALLAVAALAVVAIALRLFLSKEDRDKEQPTKRRDAVDRRTPAYLREFVRLCQELGRPRGVGETLRETLAALGEIGVGATGLQPMVDYHYGIQYEDAPRDRSRESRLRKSLRVLRKAAQAG